MATTTNYGWDTPDDTDLVKDGAAAIRTLGSSVDTTTKNLNPQTTTGALAYRSATANINTALPIGTAGQVLKVNSGGTAPEWGTTADQTPLTTKGDLFTFSTVDARLGVGANNTVLVADSSEATGLKWAAPSGGKFVGISSTQTGTVATGTTIMPFDNTIPQNTEGDQYMSLAYTPSSATNKLQIDVFVFGSLGANSLLGMALFQDATANALAGNISYFVGGPTQTYVLSLRHTMTAGTTSSTTFKVRIGPSDPATFTFAGRSGTAVFGGVAACSLTVTEYQV